MTNILEGKQDKFRGALVGLAIGDALGEPLEFQRYDPNQPRRITGMQDGGPFGLKAGVWTDDTIMALCLGESLLRMEGMDLIDQLKLYVEWYTHGHHSPTGRCFDIGGTTRQALRYFMRTGEHLPIGVAGVPSNGSIMRLAPVPMFFAGDRNNAAFMSTVSSVSTHVSPAAQYGCGVLGAMIARGLQGVSKEGMFPKNYGVANSMWADGLLETFGQGAYAKMAKLDKIETSLHLRRVIDVEAGMWETKSPPEIKGAGSVWNTLEAAVWAFAKTDTFKDGALLAVNLADDSDTVGAVYGQIAGSFYGYEAIPAEWREVLYERQSIVDMADMLYDCAVGRAESESL